MLSALQASAFLADLQWDSVMTRERGRGSRRGEGEGAGDGEREPGRGREYASGQLQAIVGLLDNTTHHIDSYLAYKTMASGMAERLYCKRRFYCARYPKFLQLQMLTARKSRDQQISNKQPITIRSITCDLTFVFVGYCKNFGNTIPM